MYNIIMNKTVDLLNRRHVIDPIDISGAIFDEEKQFKELLDITIRSLELLKQGKDLVAIVTHVEQVTLPGVSKYDSKDNYKIEVVYPADIRRAPAQLTQSKITFLINFNDLYGCDMALDNAIGTYNFFSNLSQLDRSAVRLAFIFWNGYNREINHRGNYNIYNRVMRVERDW